jgi:hypothetical protein
MKIGSVYHNLKILQSEDFQFFKTTDLIKDSKAAGRRVTQIVYRVPKAYYVELEKLLEKQEEDGNYKETHKEITYFNFLKLKGILALYASMLQRDRILVTNKTDLEEDWYEKWMDLVKFDNQIASPGIIYTIHADKMKKVLEVINDCCETSKDKDKEKEKHSEKEINEPMVQFSYLVFPHQTAEMRNGEWISRKEHEERKKELPPKVSSKEALDCEKDHETLFKYGLACPVCNNKPPK